ncbi:MAG: hypothetical protein J6S98_01500, partial [Lentisphaeria bacterium]|nr:hypothetical protein [Lentisphaeria bacterium]
SVKSMRLAGPIQSPCRAASNFAFQAQCIPPAQLVVLIAAIACFFISLLEKSFGGITLTYHLNLSGEKNYDETEVCSGRHGKPLWYVY